ncbi:MAG TPA: Rne/Rng family ribonuclease [Candidatus Acidoferrales bacterium]
MSKEMVISANPHETRVAILEEGQLCEYYVERDKEFALVGSIYKGKVTRVLPGMQSAFVEIGLDSDAFLYVSDFLEEIEGLDHVETADEKAKAAAGGGAAAPALNAGAGVAGEPGLVGSGEGVGEGSAQSYGEASSAEPGNAAPYGATPAASSSFVRPAGSSSSSGQGYQNRPPQRSGSGGGDRGGDRGGRNRFGGRGGRNRPGGGRGGSGGGGGRSGDRRFGRELPSSKYASPRGPEDGTLPEATGPEGHISTVLPGESLAKFRERPAGAEHSSFGAESGGGEHEGYSGAESSTSPLHEIVEPRALGLDAPTGPSDREAALLASFGSFEAPDAQPAAPPREHREHRERGNFGRSGGRPGGRGSRDRGGFSSGRSSGGFSSGGSSLGDTSGVSSGAASGGFSSGIEPLPGETLSKWKAHTHLPPEPPSDNEPVPDAVAFAPLSPLMPAGPEVDTADISAVSEIHSEHIFSDEQTASERAETDSASDTHEFHEMHGDEAGHHESASERAETDGGHEADAAQAHAHTELTDEEATALAEHIAEAQEDLAARDAQQRGFAAADAAAEGVAEAHGEASASELEEEHEEEELEEEEAAAEEEGMIAHAELETSGELADEHAAHLEEHHDEHEAQAEGFGVEGDSGDLNPEEQEALSADAGADGAPLSEEGLAASAEGAAAQPAQPFQARVRNDFRSRMQNPARRGGRDRGGRRDDRGGRRPNQGHSGHSGGHHRPSAPRRTQLIADMLKQGQEIIVQIAKEPLGKKGARITSHVALPGRFLVYMPTLDHNGVSRKIASAEERSRLRHLVNDAKGSAGGGFIVRTAASTADPAEVRADVEFLTRTWAEIKARSDTKKAPSLVHRDLNLVQRILRDYITPDFGAIWVDTEEEYTKVVDFMSRFQPQLVGRVKLYTKETPVFEEFGIQQEIDKGLRPKVWLKSGGYIVINHTEALVAIDVNTGKFVGKGSNRLEDTIVRTNMEACKEIVRQMRLRDLGGIIIIDFIDMEERRNRDKVMAILEDALRADRAPSKVLRFNEFGLVAITRKRTKQALERTLCQPCPYCTGSGMVKSIPTLCYEIQTEARKMAPDLSAGSITLRVHPEISKALKTRESSLIEELENWTKKSIIIQADPTLHWEQYDIY